jgi:hypothetical protein
VQGQAYGVVVVEDRWLVDADNLSGEEVEDEYLAIFKHDETYVFVVIVCLVRNDNLHYRLLLKFMSQNMRFCYFFLFVGVQFHYFDESVPETNENHNPEGKIIGGSFSFFFYFLLFLFGNDSCCDCGGSSIEIRKFFLVILTIFFVECEESEVELCLGGCSALVVRVFPGKEVYENIVEFLKVTEVIGQTKIVEMFGVLCAERFMGSFAGGGHGVSPLGVVEGYLFEGFAETCLLEVHF